MEMNNDNVLRLRGLPYDSTNDDVKQFFDGIDIKPNSIMITKDDMGRHSGEAFVQFKCKEDAEEAIKKDRGNMGKRYIEIFASSLKEVPIGKPLFPTMEMNNDNVLRLRGLPYDSTTDDVEKFFDGITISANCIKIPTDDIGRNSGEAFVQFNSKEDVREAMKKNKENMGSRYVEIFPSSLREALIGKPLVLKAQNLGKRGRPGPYQSSPSYGRGFGMDMEHMLGLQSLSAGYGRGFGRNVKGLASRQSFNSDIMGNNLGMDVMAGHVIRMRGLPFSATEIEVAEWFSSVADPVHVTIDYNNEGKPSGEASVYFSTAQDAKAAMSKNKQSMAHRYIELFEENRSAGELDTKLQIMMGGGIQPMGMGRNMLMDAMGMNRVGFNQNKMSMGGSGLDINQVNSMAKLSPQAFQSFALGGY